MTSKNCTKCNKIKLLSDFHNRAASKDGLCYICKKCNCAKATSYRNKNIDKVRKKDKERSKSKDRKYESKIYREKYPEKYMAHKEVCIAMQKGELKMQPCEVCGNQQSHAHHDDYNKCLEVRWLCSIHHAEHHRAMIKNS